MPRRRSPNWRDLSHSTRRAHKGSAREGSWPSQLEVPSRKAEQGRAAADDMTTITFYVYEWNEWKVDRVIAVDPSDCSLVEMAVWKYKRRDMFVYNMKMKTVDVASSFREATAGGNNVLLLVQFPDRPERILT
ncbi:hypothetical protein BDDG_08693 [Blastomyces dermatitidis ATCC 18188]|uniref:Uncharacterized protein n=1 Tax=Ajellomyces dermatitidis (strain ATCC 18188 / CBS 674.68) TaxID=653446 RepID=F2TR85_AJEDA|nr:hypothetical protein BDDG_08693 [Blastomyces dermatitidis ATCC 18188]EQL34805.1 hypothetical protein BDFG_03497 [Blastomyces dermatitidis ATCC 26199]